MKKLTNNKLVKKPLLLSTENVRTLNNDVLRGVVGGFACSPEGTEPHRASGGC